MDHHEWGDWDEEHLADIPEEPDDEFTAPDLTLDDSYLDDDPSPIDDLGVDPDLDSGLDTDTEVDLPEEPLALDEATPDTLDPADDLTPDHDQAWNPAPDDTPIGADPDLSPDTDDSAWLHTPFPEPIELTSPPEPIDGFPWSDPTTLGTPNATDHHLTWLTPVTPTDPADLAAYSLTSIPPGQDPWASLLRSEDPATSSLARWWTPGG